MQSVVIINLFWIPLGLSCFHRDISHIYTDLVYYCGYIYSSLGWSRVFFLRPAVCSPLKAWSHSCFPAFIPVCLVLFESALYTSVVEQGGGWGRMVRRGGFIALTRSVKTHPSLPLLCPGSPPPVSILSFFLCSPLWCSAGFLHSNPLITCWIWKNTHPSASSSHPHWWWQHNPTNQAREFLLYLMQPFCYDARLRNAEGLHNVCWGCLSVIRHPWHTVKHGPRKVYHYCCPLLL